MSRLAISILSFLIVLFSDTYAQKSEKPVQYELDDLVLRTTEINWPTEAYSSNHSFFNVTADGTQHITYLNRYDGKIYYRKVSDNTTEELVTVIEELKKKWASAIALDENKLLYVVYNDKEHEFEYEDNLLIYDLNEKKVILKSRNFIKKHLPDANNISPQTINLESASIYFNWRDDEKTLHYALYSMDSDEVYELENSVTGYDQLRNKISFIKDYVIVGNSQETDYRLYNFKGEYEKTVQIELPIDLKLGCNPPYPLYCDHVYPPGPLSDGRYLMWAFNDDEHNGNPMDWNNTSMKHYFVLNEEFEVEKHFQLNTEKTISFTAPGFTILDMGVPQNWEMHLIDLEKILALN